MEQINSSNTQGTESFSNKETLPKNLKSFSWGAFCLFPFWGLFNGARTLSCITFAIWIFNICSNSLLAILLSLISVGISIYFGFKGNRYSWKKKHWDSAEDFERVQHNWNIAGIIAFIVAFIIGFIYGIIIGSNPSYY